MLRRISFPFALAGQTASNIQLQNRYARQLKFFAVLVENVLIIRTFLRHDPWLSERGGHSDLNGLNNAVVAGIAAFDEINAAIPLHEDDGGTARAIAVAVDEPW